MYRVLSCVVYTLIENYICIDYLSCKSKNLSAISYNTTFKDTSFNILLGMGITELLLNLVSCHILMKKTNSINNYLAEGFSTIEQKKSS